MGLGIFGDANLGGLRVGVVFTEDGRLVATCTQDNLVRLWTDGKDHTADYRHVM